MTKVMIPENICKSLASTEIPWTLTWNCLALVMKNKWDLQTAQVFVFPPQESYTKILPHNMMYFCNNWGECVMYEILKPPLLFVSK